MVLFQALCLGIPASLLGLGAGYLLSAGVFHQSTSYLAEAFTLSGGTVVSTRAVLLLAASAGSSRPAWPPRCRCSTCAAGARATPSIEERGVPGNGLQRSAAPAPLRARRCACWRARPCCGRSLPAAAIPATALLALATVLAVPLAFAGVLRGAASLGERFQRISILPLALASLRATTLRSLALAATGAVALFGSVALGGSRANLLSGINSLRAQLRGRRRHLGLEPRRQPGRQLLLPRQAPPRASPGCPPSPRVQTLPRRLHAARQPPRVGDRAPARRRAPRARKPDRRRQRRSVALARLTQGGWIAVSQQIASEHHLGVGGTLVLPTPTGPRPFRIAATTTNLAWPPGVIFMSAADFTRAWASTDPTTLGVLLRPGASAACRARAIEAALGPASGLEVSLAATRAARIDALASEGLGQLREISTLLLLAAIWRWPPRWPRASGSGAPDLPACACSAPATASLQRILLIEATLMLSAGCLTGALAGVYGQVVIDAFLRHVTGFPLASPTAGARPLEILLFVLVAALALGAIPGWLAARVRPVLALADE